jgi:hypothetical protein
MNGWLDRGSFCIVCVGVMWISDAVLSNTGKNLGTYPTLMIGL